VLCRQFVVDVAGCFNILLRRFQVFRQRRISPAAGREAASLIEKETLKKRISINE
jgi:hypothetical protein